MSRNIYILLSLALAFPLADMTAEPMALFATNGLDFTGLAPYAYRPLFLLIWHGLNTIMPPFAVAWVICFVTLAVTAVLIDETARKHGDRDKARLFLIAAFAVTPAVVMGQTAGAHWNLIEAVFYAAALLMVLDGRTWALYPLVVVATLNRETAVFIPLLFWLATGKRAHAVGLLMVWAVTYGAIRAAVGPVPPHYTLPEILAINTMLPSLARLAIGLPFLAWLFWYAWQGWRRADGRIRRVGYVVPVYLAAVLVFGVWTEWRLLISLYPVLVLLAGARKAYSRTITGTLDWEPTHNYHLVPAWEPDAELWYSNTCQQSWTLRVSTNGDIDWVEVNDE